MKIKDNKCKCGHDDFFFADKGNQKGIYCSYCGKWLKWADKDEQNLRMKQASVLDKIIDEIKKAVWEDVIVNIDGTDEVRIPRLDPDDVLGIIDKYKAESEDKK